MKIIEKMRHFPLLSFRDLELWLRAFGASIEESRVQRVFVPAIPDHPSGYPKNTLVLELRTRSSSIQLLLSFRPRECGMVLHPDRTLRPATSASKSGFILALSKAIEGSLFARLDCVPGDRIALLRFEGSNTFDLHVHLIPGRPLGVLLQDGNLLGSTDQRTTYKHPEPREWEAEKARTIPVHPEWFADPDTYRSLWMQAEKDAVLGLRARRAQQRLESELQALLGKKQSLEEQLLQTERDPDWAAQGSLLQANLYRKPRLSGGFYELEDPATGDLQRLRGDSRLAPEEQLERWFHLAKRKRRRETESRERLSSIQDRIGKLESLRSKLADAESPPPLDAIEEALGIRNGTPPVPSKEQKKISGFGGKHFVTREGLTVLAGRNSAENLELTFKIARGNDVWLHVKGRPGSHTVILLPPGRTASLESLLDAANLCVYYSGGKDWGKTEVDYTLRKFVKKIKNHNEVSYGSAKTLVVSVDEERLRRIQHPSG
ncbi:DUF814 domain-containing protein [bacterium]|nr:DUF814 domain-containing protein [bacterium]